MNKTIPPMQSQKNNINLIYKTKIFHGDTKK